MSIQWPLVIFSLLAGAGSGTLVFIGLSELLNKGAKARFSAGIIALVLLVLGGIASVLHLGHPGSVMSAVANLGSFSGISIELILLGLSVVVAIIYVILAKREGADGARKAFGVIGLVLGAVFAFALGSSYLVSAKEHWNNLSLPLAYFGSGLTIGGFIYLALAAGKSDAADVKGLALYVLVAAVIQTLAFLAFGVLAGAAAIADNGVLFWVGAIVIGAIVPLVTGYLVFKNAEKTTLVYAGVVGALIGGIAIRALMWAVGSAFLPNLFDVAANSRGLFPF